MTRYLNEDGSVSYVVCGVCQGEIEFTEHEDGSRTGACPCGKSSFFSLDMGELDLELVRVEDDHQDFEILAPPFTRVSGSVGIVRDSVMHDRLDWNSRDGVTFRAEE